MPIEDAIKIVVGALLFLVPFGYLLYLVYFVPRKKRAELPQRLNKLEVPGTQDAVRSAVRETVEEAAAKRRPEDSQEALNRVAQWVEPQTPPVREDPVEIDKEDEEEEAPEEDEPAVELTAHFAKYIRKLREHFGDRRFATGEASEVLDLTPSRTSTLLNEWIEMEPPPVKRVAHGTYQNTHYRVA